MSQPPSIPPQAVPLQYAQPPAGTSRNFAMYWLAHWVLWSIVLGLPLGIAMLVAPRFAVIFKDFKVELPALTRCALLAARYFWLAVPIPALIATAFVGLAAVNNANQRRVFYYSFILAWLVFAALVLLSVLAVFLPMTNLMSAVGKP